jgi:hypothetical protein
MPDGGKDEEMGEIHTVTTREAEVVREALKAEGLGEIDAVERLEIANWIYLYIS